MNDTELYTKRAESMLNVDTGIMLGLEKVVAAYSCSKQVFNKGWRTKLLSNSC